MGFIIPINQFMVYLNYKMYIPFLYNIITYQEDTFYNKKQLYKQVVYEKDRFINYHKN